MQVVDCVLSATATSSCIIFNFQVITGSIKLKSRNIKKAFVGGEGSRCEWPSVLFINQHFPSSQADSTYQGSYEES